MRASQTTAFLKFALPLNQNVLLVGPPGVGKTDIIKNAVAGLDYRLLINHPVISEPTDYKGLPFAQGEEAVFLPYGQLKSLISAKEPTVFFLDDVGSAPNSVQSALMQLLLERRIDDKPISEHVRFIAATNRHGDRSNVSGILEAVKSRFASIINLEVNSDDWIEWANKHRLPVELISFIRFKPTMLHDFTPSKEIANYPCPRTVAKVGMWLNSSLPKEMEAEVFEGTAGKAFAIEFNAFLRLFRDLPDPRTILKNPTKATVFKELDKQYAICGALSNLVDESTFENMITYLERLSPEFAVMTMRDVMQRKANVFSVHPAFMKWAVTNKEFLLAA